MVEDSSARVNPLENNYRLYKVVDGKRVQLATAEVEAPVNVWNTLRIVHQGRQIRCYLNDRLHLETQDATFPEPGKVGPWTKADAQTRFTDMRIDELAPAAVKK